MEEDMEIIKRANEYASRINTKSKREYKQLVGAYVVGSDEMRKQKAQNESNLRDIRLDTIQCCEEYLAKFGTLDGVYEHYFADVNEK